MLPKDVTGHDVRMVLAGVISGLVAGMGTSSLGGDWWWTSVATGMGASLGSIAWDSIMRPKN